MKKKILTILSVGILLTSCGGNDNYSQNYESASLIYREKSISKEGFYNVKEINLDESLLNFSKNLFFDYVNDEYSHIYQLGEGHQIDKWYSISFKFGNEHDTFMVSKYSLYPMGSIQSDKNLKNKDKPEYFRIDLYQRYETLVDQLERLVEDVDWKEVKYF